MNIKQIEIGNLILDYLKDRGYSSYDDLNGYIMDSGYDYSDFLYVFQMMRDDFKFIADWSAGVDVKLTYEGLKISVNGFSDFMNQERKREETKDKVSRTTLYSNYLNIANLILTVLAFITGILLSDPIKGIIGKLFSTFSSWLFRG